MQRFFALLALIVLSIPVGLSITGCQTPVGDYCNGQGYGPKLGQVASISLGPETTGISVAWGQTAQLGTPSAIDCKNSPVSVSHYTYGSSDLLLADVSPTGEVCGGTWNRNSPGGIANYTICTPPSGSSTSGCTSTSCGVVQMSVSGGGASSNPVPVYVHPPITAIEITQNAESACVSQNQSGPTYSPSGTPPTVKVLGPDGVAIDPSDIGTIDYTAETPSIVNINNTSVSGTGVNGATTAQQPGATVIDASVSKASSGSAAGYFYTCPPASIQLTLNGSATGVTSIKKGTPVFINAVVKDTKGATMNGLALSYTTTEPQNFAVTSDGQVTANWPGDAYISATCQPATCNPSPVSQIGIFGTGTPVVSNTLQVTSPGQNSNILWMASTQSQYFSSVDLTTGTPGIPVRLPYPPNSMVASQDGEVLYFGSYRELMTFNSETNALTKQDTSVPGVVLAVSPDGTQLIINDQLRKVIYLYSTTSGIISSIQGVATRASWAPNGNTVYITGPNALYVYNVAVGWNTYSTNTTPTGPTQPNLSSCLLDNNTVATGAVGTNAYDPFCAAHLAQTVPSEGVFVTGSPTTAWGFCPNTSGTTPIYYPQAASIGVETDALTATPDGDHILGAATTGLTDIWLYQDASKSTPGAPTGGCPAANTGLQFQTTDLTTNFSTIGLSPAEIDQVVDSQVGSTPGSSIAFVTYNNDDQSAGSGILPYYIPSTTPGQPGILSKIQLSGTAKSPIAGIFSPNEQFFFVSTSGDNLVHYIQIGSDPATTAPTDIKTINPGLVNGAGQPVPVQMMAVRARSTTN